MLTQEYYDISTMALTLIGGFSVYAGIISYFTSSKLKTNNTKLIGTVLFALGWFILAIASFGNCLNKLWCNRFCDKSLNWVTYCQLLFPFFSVIILMFGAYVARRSFDKGKMAPKYSMILFVLGWLGIILSFIFLPFVCGREFSFIRTLVIIVSALIILSGVYINRVNEVKETNLPSGGLILLAGWIALAFASGL